MKTPSLEQRQQELKRRDIVYERMARYGINREDVKSIGGGMHVETGEKHTPYHTYDMIIAHKVLRPGEHYRFELDDYIVTMRVPDAPPGSAWIVPYADTRTEPEREGVLRRSRGGLQVANLGWHYGTGVYPLYFGWQGHLSMTIAYNTISPKGIETDYANPENMRRQSQEVIESFVPPQAEIEQAAREGKIDNRAGTRIFLNAESVVINGRVWIHHAVNMSYFRRYTYRTVLRPDRLLVAGFSVPDYDYNAHPDFSTYPAALKRAFADMEAMVASLRVARINDDGSPDPFVIERVEPAPLPVREPMPSVPVQ